MENIFLCFEMLSFRKGLACACHIINSKNSFQSDTLLAFKNTFNFYLFIDLKTTITITITIKLLKWVKGTFKHNNNYDDNNDDGDADDDDDVLNYLNKRNNE